MSDEASAEIDYARRFLLLWGALSIVMFCAAAILTAVLVRVTLPENDYQVVGMYGTYRTKETGWIYFQRQHRSSNFLVYYPAGSAFVALPYGRFDGCIDGETKRPLPPSAVETNAYQSRRFYLIALAGGKPVASKGTMTCTIAFEFSRESFTSYSMDVWFLPERTQGFSPLSVVNVSAIVEGAEYMQVFGARLTSESGADLVPDDEAVIKYTDIRRSSLRDIGLVLIGAFVALGAAMALEAIRPYVEARAGVRKFD